MSGGVDSGVAAALMAEQGHDVTGVTLKLWCYGHSPVSPRACCTLDAIDDARRVAERLEFRHFVVDAEDVFRARVLQPFLDDYARGRTPYPCAQCNQSLKFGDLVTRMAAIGADWLVTGHYARVGADDAGAPALRRAVDATKDQSYALALVPYASLARAVFPLGGMTSVGWLFQSVNSPIEWGGRDETRWARAGELDSLSPARLVKKSWEGVFAAPCRCLLLFHRHGRNHQWRKSWATQRCNCRD